MRRDVQGIVLAGGGSRRMGRDKALLDIDGSALAERAARVMASVCVDTGLAVGPGRRYPDLPWIHIEDLRPDCGPLAGLEAGLSWAAPRDLLVLACDLPRVEVSMLERLMQSSVEAQPRPDPGAWLACRDERLQPLCGLYSSGCLSVFTDRLDRGERSVFKALAAIDCRRVAFDDLDPDPFLNVNTPDDFVLAGGTIAVS